MPVKVASYVVPNSPQAREIPPVPKRGVLHPAVENTLVVMREVAAELAGQFGDPNNRAVRWSELITRGFADLAGNPTSSGSGAPSTVAGPPGPPGPPVAPDPTPPPTVTGLGIIAGLASVIVHFDVPVYAQGHGPKQTNIYAVKKASADPTLPTFPGAAGLVIAAPHALGLIALPSDLSTRWHVWAKYETNDGVESASPAGGVNGVSATTGVVGSADLGPLIVQARNLAAANPGVFPDPTFEGGAAVWPVGFVQRKANTDVAVPTGCPRDFAAQFQDRDSFGVGLPITAFPGDQYRFSCYVNRTGLGAVSAGLVLHFLDASNASIGVSAVPAATPTTASSTWDLVQGKAQAPVGTVRMIVGPWINQSAGGTGKAWFTGLLVEKAIDASLVTANMIVAGSGAMGNLAVEHAAIGLLAVDDANVAALSAAKLTVGDGTVGGDLKSSNYVFGVSGWIVRPNGYAEFDFANIRGQLVAAQIGAGQVTASKINVSQLSAISADMGTMTAGSVHGGFFHSGAYTNTYAFPSLSGQTGFHLSGSGLLLGNFIDGRYFRVDANGDLFAPDFQIVGGVATFSGDLNAAGGNFAGSLSAAAIVLAGQSLFLPAWAGATSVVHPNNRWSQILSAGPVNPGATGNVAITVTAAWTADQSVIWGGEQSADQNVNVFPRYRVKRNGSVIGTWSPYSSGLAGETSHTLSDTPGGSATYTLEHIIGDEFSFILPNSTTGASIYRTLLVQGVTR